MILVCFFFAGFLLLVCDSAPSDPFDRREFVILMGESHEAQKQEFLPIIRRDKGKFFGFDESEVLGVDELKGRFA